MKLTQQLSKQSINKIIRGGIEETIRLHGNITPRLVESATKRAAGRIYGELKALEQV
jgi:hypothetical protein